MASWYATGVRCLDTGLSNLLSVSKSTADVKYTLGDVFFNFSEALLGSLLEDDASSSS